MVPAGLDLSPNARTVLERRYLRRDAAGDPVETPEEMLRRARELRAEMLRRRTIRQFSDRPVAREVIEECLRVAASAPSGANRQPWRFVVVSEPGTKRRLREETIDRIRASFDSEL